MDDIWIQELAFSHNELQLKGQRSKILDSSNIFWARGLIEGPEIIRKGDYYYLFVASCNFCKPCYSESVARSKNVWGPYEILGIPLLSTGLIGNHASRKEKLIGPGHASFVLDEKSNTWYVVWHASIEGPDCPGGDENSEYTRKSFISRMKFTEGSDGGWPYIDFETMI